MVAWWSVSVTPEEVASRPPSQLLPSHTCSQTWLAAFLPASARRSLLGSLTSTTVCSSEVDVTPAGEDKVCSLLQLLPLQVRYWMAELSEAEAS